MKKIYLQVKFFSDHPEIKDGEWTSIGRHDGYDVENEKELKELANVVAFYKRQKQALWRLVEMVEVPYVLKMKVNMHAKTVNGTQRV